MRVNPIYFHFCLQGLIMRIEINSTPAEVDAIIVWVMFMPNFPTFSSYFALVPLYGRTYIVPWAVRITKSSNMQLVCLFSSFSLTCCLDGRRPPAFFPRKFLQKCWSKFNELAPSILAWDLFSQAGRQHMWIPRKLTHMHYSECGVCFG